VDRAIREQYDRVGGRRRHYLEAIAEESFQITTLGEGIAGEGNGLMVSVTGDRVKDAGAPVRITAAFGRSAGKFEIVFNDDVTELTGPSFKKAGQNIKGYYHNEYAQEITLTGRLSISFEGLNGLDGNSATMVSTLVSQSRLSGIKFKPNVAVTGSMDQPGRVAGIGGVNEKIWGFYQVAKFQAEEARQPLNAGVVIPRVNVKNLMLPEVLIEEVKAGRFHIWAVDTINEAMEITMGRKAKEIHAKVIEKFKEYAPPVEPAGPSVGGLQRP